MRPSMMQLKAQTSLCTRRCATSPVLAVAAPSIGSDGWRRALVSTPRVLQLGRETQAPAESSLAANLSSVIDAVPQRAECISHQQPVARPISEQMLADCATAFSSLLNEYDYWVDKTWVEGTIPTDLEGTYFRNGPGLQVDTEHCRRHAFDGDGMVFSLAFKQGRAFFRNKFVKTKGFVDEQEASQPLYRTTFSSGSPNGNPFFNPFDLTFKNVANTGVHHWAGKLYALWEAGRPYELDPHTLDTLGESSLGGLLQGHCPLAGHYRVVDMPASSSSRCSSEASTSGRTAAESSSALPSGRSSSSGKRWVSFGSDISVTGIKVRFYEHDEDGQLAVQSSHQLSGVDVTFIHDMVVTENYYVLLLGPIKFNWVKFFTQYMIGRCSVAQCLEYDHKGQVKVMLFPRPDRPGASSRQPVTAFTANAFFPFHHLNAYEDSEGKVVVDTVGWNEVDFDINRFITTPEYYQGGCRPQYLRVKIDPMNPNPAARQAAECTPMLLQRTVEFPMISPAATGKRHKFAYFTADRVGHEFLWGPAQVLIKISLPEDEASASSSASAASFAAPGASSSSSANNIVTGSERLLRTKGAARRDASPSRQSGPASAAAAAAAGPQLMLRAEDGTPLYSASSASNQGMLSAVPGLKVEEWGPGPRSFCGEAMLVPKPGSVEEDDAWLIVGVHNAETLQADICILDASRLSEGPVATIHLPHHLPASLHGSFSPVYLGPDPEDSSVPSWKAPKEYLQL